jgi:hypothetical protein
VKDSGWTYSAVAEVRVASDFSELCMHMISRTLRTEDIVKLTFMIIFIRRVLPSFFLVRPVDGIEIW